MSIRVLVADDHPLFREGVAALLTSDPGTELAGTAATGTEAVVRARKLKPDVVVMDLQMPELDGIEATRQIVADCPNTAVLVLSMFEDDESLFSAMRAGASGYVLKGAEQDQIGRAIRAVAAGEAIFSPGVARRIAGFMETAETARRPFPELSEREREVLEALAVGRQVSQIAADLGLSAKTVRNTVSSILNKLHVVDRSAAIARAREAGLGR